MHEAYANVNVFIQSIGFIYMWLVEITLAYKFDM